MKKISFFIIHASICMYVCTASIMAQTQPTIQPTDANQYPNLQLQLDDAQLNALTQRILMLADIGAQALQMAPAVLQATTLAQAQQIWGDLYNRRAPDNVTTAQLQTPYQTTAAPFGSQAIDDIPTDVARSRGYYGR